MSIEGMKGGNLLKTRNMDESVQVQGSTYRASQNEKEQELREESVSSKNVSNTEPSKLSTHLISVHHDQLDELKTATPQFLE